MGLDMAPTDAAFGFKPYGNILRAQLYAVNTAPTIAFYHHDVVVAGGAIVSTPHGYMMDIEDGSVIDGNSAALLGSIVGIFDENMDPAYYIAVGETGNSTIAGYVLVADHPQQMFIAQEDADGNAIDLAEGGMNADIIPPALNAGNTNTGISKQEIDSDTANTTASLHVKLYQPHPDDTPATDTYWCRWICQINTHYWGDTIAGL